MDTYILEMFQQYKKAIFSHRKFYKTALTTRTFFQDMRIEKLALIGNIKASSLRKQVNNKEDSRSQDRCTRTMLGKNCGTGITQANTIDHINTKVIECTTKTEIEGANIQYLPELFYVGTIPHSTPISY